MRNEHSAGFHYNREERLAARHTAPPEHPSGLFRRNRSLLIILLDIVVIIIMFILFTFIFNPGRSWARVGDYRADLTTFVFDGEVYVSVEVSRVRERSEPVTGADTLVKIRFPGRDELLDVLPSVRGDHITESMVYAAGERTPDEQVAVEVEMFGTVVRLASTPD